MFHYDTKLEEFEAENFKEEILGHEIRQEEVSDILVQINNRFILKDLSCLRELKAQIKLSLWVNIVFSPLLMLLVAYGRRAWILLPQGENFPKNHSDRDLLYLLASLSHFKIFEIQ
jgi:hypothetical protein